MRTSTATLVSLPTGRNVALLQHAQQLHLQVQRQLADLVEEERAAVGAAEAAGRGRRRRR